MELEELGYRKVVWLEKDELKTVKGQCFLDSDFLRVETGSGNIILGRNFVVAIKDIRERTGYEPRERNF